MFSYPDSCEVLSLFSQKLSFLLQTSNKYFDFKSRTLADSSHGTRGGLEIFQWKRLLWERCGVSEAMWGHTERTGVGPLQARVVFGNHENSSSMYCSTPVQILILNPCTQGSFPEICESGWTSLIQEVIMTENTALSHSADMRWVVYHLCPQGAHSLMQWGHEGDRL